MSEIEIDKQHRELVDVMEDVRTAIGDKQPLRKLDQLFERFQFLLLAHCSAEELVSKLKRYPESRAQRQEHSRIFSNFTKVKQLVASHEWRIALEYADAIKYALLSHSAGFAGLVLHSYCDQIQNLSDHSHNKICVLK